MEKAHLYKTCEAIASYVWGKKDFATNSLHEGRAGAAVFFYEFFSFSENRDHQDMADYFIGTVADNINVNEGKSFADGILGVGWALKTLQKNDFVELEDEVFSEIDTVAIFHSCEGFGLMKGFLGIATYLLRRLEGKSIHDKKYHMHFEKLIESNEVLADCIKIKMHQDNLYSHHDYPAFLFNVTISSQQAFLNTVTDLAFYYSRLIDLCIQPEIAFRCLKDLVNIITGSLKTALSDRFIYGHLPYDSNEPVAILTVFELYAAAKILRYRHPELIALQGRLTYDAKMLSLISRIQFFDNENNFKLALKHLVLLKEMEKCTFDNTTMDSESVVALRQHRAKLNNELVNTVNNKIEQPEADRKYKMGLTGFAGAGLYLLNELTQVTDHYNDSVGVY